MIIGLSAYGRCIGVTRTSENWLAAPRTGLSPEVFNGNHRAPGGPRMVASP